MLIWEMNNTWRYNMKVNYSKFFNKLKNEGITQKQFKEEAKINSNTLMRFRRNESVKI